MFKRQKRKKVAPSGLSFNALDSDSSHWAVILAYLNTLQSGDSALEVFYL
jgi:hypothetical protein